MSHKKTIKHLLFSLTKLKHVCGMILITLGLAGCYCDTCHHSVLFFCEKDDEYDMCLCLSHAGPCPSWMSPIALGVATCGSAEVYNCLSTCTCVNAPSQSCACTSTLITDPSPLCSIPTVTTQCH